MDTGTPHARRSPGRLIGVLFALGVLAALALPSQALAHHANATFTCDEVTYSYLSFSNSPDNTTTYTVKIDPGTAAEQILTGEHVFAGENGVGIVTLPVLSGGDHPIEAWAEWDTNGHTKPLHKVGQATVTCLPPQHRDCTILGTSGADFLDGDINPILAELICGFEDDDTLNGLTGDDILRGHEGADNLDGGPGNDKLIGGAGDDNLLDGDGNDKHKGGPGEDNIFDSAGNNKVYGGPGIDSIVTGDGNDVIGGGEGGDVGNEESIFSAGGDDKVLGGKGADSIDGGVGNDKLLGGTGDDLLTSADGDNLLRGGKGDDLLTSGPGADRLLGGPGADRLESDGGADRLVGGPGADYMDSGSEDDVIFSMHEDNEIDTIICGDGNDTVYYRPEDNVDLATCENLIPIT